MIRILFYFLLFIFSTNIIAQRPEVHLKENKKAAAKAQFICQWGDKKLMELHSNQLIYTFKTGLEDGRYTAFFDKKYKDSALTVTFENGRMNGLLKRWDEDGLAEECEYKNGLMNGYRKLYFRAEDGNTYLNVEKCKDHACSWIYNEW